MREPDRHRDHELPLPGRARDADPAAEVADRVVVVLAEELREPEVVGGVQAAAQRAVVERVELGGGVRAQRLRLGDPAEPERAEALQCGRDGREPGHADVRRGRPGTPGPGDDAVEVTVVERVGRELHLQVGGRERAFAQRRLLGEQPRVGGAVAAEQVLAHRAARDQPRPHRGELRTDERETGVERLERGFEPAGRGARLREPDEQLQPRRQRLGRLRQQPQRRREPVRGRRGSARRGVAPGLDQHAHRLRVARPRAALEVMRPRGERAAARLECRRRAPVRTDPPAARGRVVDRVPHERVPEAIAPRRVRRDEQRAREQLIEGIEGEFLRDVGGGDREVQVHGVARDRRALRQRAARLAERRDLLLQRAHHRARHARLAGLRGDAAARRVLARELLQEEGVAAARLEDLPAHGGGDAVPEQRLRVRERQRPQRVLDHAPVALGGRQRGGEQRPHRRGPERQHEQDRAARGPAQQRGDRLQRRVVGPLQIVQREHDGPGRRQPFQQRPYRTVRAVALVLQPGRHPPHQGQHGRELRQLIADQPLEPIHAQERGVIAQRVLPDAERQLALQLRRTAGQDQRVAGPRGQLIQQPRLADPALAREREHPAAALRAPRRSRPVPLAAREVQR